MPKQKSPILGAFSRTRSPSAADNAAVNLGLEVIETKDGFTPGFLFLDSGLDLLTTVGDGPIRGMLALKDLLYVVSGGDVYSLTTTYKSTLLGSIGTNNSPVSMFQNTKQLMIADGVGAWLVPGGYPFTGGTIQSGGSLYQVNDQVTLLAKSGTQNSYPIVQVTSITNTPVVSYTLPNAGTTYSSASNVATTNIQPIPGSGSGLTLNITATSGQITAVSVDVGGTGYANGNTGVVNTGGSNAVYQVTSNSAGVVTGVRMLNQGTGYVTTIGVTTTRGPGITPNSGMNFTLDITASSGPISGSTIANAGNNYAVGNAGLVSGGTGDATYLVTAVGPYGVVTGFSIVQGGAIDTVTTEFTQKSTTGSGSGLDILSPTFGDYIGVVPITVPFDNPFMGDISDGFGLLVFNGSQNIAQSDELDLSTWQPLNYGVADQSPDNCVALKVIHDEAFVLKQTNTEVWVDEGNPNFAFGPIVSVHVEYGIIAPFSVAIADEELIWLSRNAQGQAIVVMARGYTPQPISSQALVNELQSYANVGDAIAYARQEGGHVYYVITFPQANVTWIYDKTTSALLKSPIWHQLAAFDQGALNRHWGNAFTLWQGAQIETSNTDTYCATPVEIIAPTLLETSSNLPTLPASFSTAVFSIWVELLDDTGQHGVIFSNQTDDTHGATNPGLFIEIANDQTVSPQITIMAWDASNAIIVSATYDFMAWFPWVDILISIDTTTQELQLYANDGPLTPASITWSSTNPIANPVGSFWHIVNAVSAPPPAAGSEIAELIVPSDGFGTPTYPILDWINGKVYLLSGAGGGGAAIRSYDTALVTQNPINAAWLLGVSGSSNPYCGDVDLLTGDPVIQVSTGYSDNRATVYKYNPSTLISVGNFGTDGSIGSYPTSIGASEALVCVACGELANPSTLIPYALLKESVFSGHVAVIRVDNMTASGAYLNVVSSGVDNRGLMCRGASGSAGASAFLTPSNYGSEVTSIPLYVVNIAPGAETYNIATWPTPNSYITTSTVGTIAASAVDPTWTTMWAATQIGYDLTDGNIFLDVNTSKAVTNKRYIIKVNSSTAAIMWATPINNVTESLSLSNISSISTAIESSTVTASGMLDEITVSTGSLLGTLLNGIIITPPTIDSSNIVAGNDTSGLVFLHCEYTEKSGSPLPLPGTPSTFTGWAIMAGATAPVVATARMADLWFGPTNGFVDLTLESNRRKFITNGWATVDLGSDGSAPFGASPPVFLTRLPSGAPNTFASNVGTGGSYAIIGPDLEDGSPGPPCNSVTTTSISTGVIGPSVLGDYRNGNIYSFNPETLTDNGTQRKWIRRWRALEKGTTAAVKYQYLTITMQTGIGVPAGTNPQIVLRWSDDGGYTWSDERIISAGATGQTTLTIKFNRLGMTRRFSGSDRIFELSSTDPFMVTINDAEVDSS